MGLTLLLGSLKHPRMTFYTPQTGPQCSPFIPGHLLGQKGDIVLSRIPILSRERLKHDVKGSYHSNGAGGESEELQLYFLAALPPLSQIKVVWANDPLPGYVTSLATRPHPHKGRPSLEI